MGGKVSISCPKTGYKCDLEFKLKVCGVQLYTCQVVIGWNFSFKIRDIDANDCWAVSIHQFVFNHSCRGLHLFSSLY